MGKISSGGDVMFREVRKLISPVYGDVLPLSGLNTGGEHIRGEGFVVRAGSAMMRLRYRFLPAADICAPTDGAVTAVSERSFRLRSGDGLEIEVLLPGDGEFYVQTGDMTRSGEEVCRISSGDLCESGMGVMVRFRDSDRLTEFHVFSGVKRAGAAAAEYSVRKPE